jgi:NodT family efflux transporter outer membrane factor (OMF) lipoprotein
MRRGARSLPRLVVLIGAVTMVGCTHLGPNFEPPGEPWIDTWNTPALDQATRSSEQPDLRQWWSVFNDPVLDQLIADADANNTDIRIAGLRVIEARAQLGIAQSGRYPQFQQLRAETLYADRSESNGRNPLDNHAWQYSAGFDVGWELDFWGRFSRAIESADAAYFAAGANYEDTLVLLHAQVAETYMAIRTTEARLRIARENTQLQKRSLEITQQLFDSGNNAELDVQQAKTQYLGTLSSIPQLEGLLNRTRNAMAILLGRPPGPLEHVAETEELVPLVDAAILNDVPAALLLRRPDVRAAEWQVASQSALVGVAVTDLYPAITLLGSIGWSTSSLDGTSDALAFGAGPSLTWNLFDYGRIRNNVRVQDARLQQLIETYRDRVRQAAREADDAATDLIKALERERILNEASEAANRSLSLATSQYREGFADFQRVLDAQRELFAQQEGYLDSRSDVVNSAIALYRALGGGWTSTQPLIDQRTQDQMQQRTNWGDLLQPTATQLPR